MEKKWLFFPSFDSVKKLGAGSHDAAHPDSGERVLLEPEAG